MIDVKGLCITFIILFECAQCFDQKLTVCEDHTVANMSCSSDEIIHWTKFVNEDGQCKNDIDNNLCLQGIYNYLMDSCINQNQSTCTLHSQSLFSTCRQIPRYVDVRYKCYDLKGRFSKLKNKEICLSDLSKLICSKRNKMLHITDIVSWEPDDVCETCNKSNILQFLKKQCDARRTCRNPTTFSSCLYHPKFVKLSYSCKGPTNSGNISTPPSPTPTHSNTGTDTSYVTGYMPYDETTETVVLSTLSYEVSYQRIQLDDENRLLFYDFETNTTFTICGRNWDSLDARVVCRHLNMSSAGHALLIDNDPSFNQTLTSLSCTGNETDPLDCEFEYIGDECYLFKVAAVCCEDHMKSLCRPNANSSADKILLSDTNTGVVVGSAVCAFVVLCLIIATVCFLARNNIFKANNLLSIKEHLNDDYVGQQDIAMPSCKSSMNEAVYAKPDCQYDNGIEVLNTSSDAASSSSNINAEVNSYFTLDPNQTGYNRTKGVTSSYEMAKSVNVQIFSEKDHYDTTTEGLYDHSNNRRHEVKEDLAYGYLGDNVYNQTDHSRKRDLNEETYDHCCGQTTEDDYNLTKKLYH